MAHARMTASRALASCGRNQGVHHTVGGFTLIELMITVAVIAILAAMAYASYESSIVKTRRSAGAACLQERAQFMERYYTTHLTYADAPALASCDADVDRYYKVSIAAQDAKSYRLQAVPQTPQDTKDAKCGTLTIDQKGAKGVSGAAAVDDCW